MCVELKTIITVLCVRHDFIYLLYSLWQYKNRALLQYHVILVLYTSSLSLFLSLSHTHTHFVCNNVSVSLLCLENEI